MKVYGLYRIGALTGNPVHFGYYLTEEQARYEASLLGDSKLFCGFRIIKERILQ